MKKLINLVSVNFLFIIAFIAPNTTLAADIVGTWAYEVSDTPPEYAEGEITFMKNGDVYSAEITVSGSVTKIDAVKVEGNTASFKVFVEGSDLKIKMTFEGDVMTGKAESYDGVFMMKGKRK
ncbi:MAG: hypothetical protein IPL46_17250 [Saprospiraceae bacterium]|nr:hypothetical protein [Saprospiraceae bacterium]